MSTANINKQRFESLANKAKVKSEIMQIMPKGFEGAAPVGGFCFKGFALTSFFAMLVGLVAYYRQPLMIQFNSAYASWNTTAPTAVDSSASAVSSADAGVTADAGV